MGKRGLCNTGQKRNEKRRKKKHIFTYVPTNEAMAVARVVRLEGRGMVKRWGSEVVLLQLGSAQLGSAQLGSAKHSLTKMGQAELSHSQISWLEPAELRLSRQLMTLGRIRKVNHIWYPAGLSQLKMEVVVYIQDFSSASASSPVGSQLSTS